jgi:uncharacterized delta-60 repeat protein
VVARYVLNQGFDPTFSAPPGGNKFAVTTVSALAAQADGKVLVGDFDTLGDIGLYRLNADGSRDTSFPPGGLVLGGRVLAILIDPAGRILICTGGNLFRLTADGSTVDNTFSMATFQIGDCSGIALQPDGKILAVGTFHQVNHLSFLGLVRFDSFGNIDFSFGSASKGGISINAQSDGAFIVGTGGAVRRYFASGQPDPGFMPPEGTQGVVHAAIDSTGRVYYNDSSTIFQYSGHRRVVIPSATIDTVLQHSTAIGGDWTSLKSIPANTASDVLLPEINVTGNEFFRLQPAQ